MRERVKVGERKKDIEMRRPFGAVTSCPKGIGQTGLLLKRHQQTVQI
jgi:hypothetical protein